MDAAHVDSLKSRLKSHNISIPPDFSDVMQRAGGEWLIGRETKYPGKSIFFCAYGDFTRGMSEHWISATELTPEEQEHFHAFKKESQRKNREDLQAKWEETRLEVEKEWENFAETGESPYFAKKKLGGLYGCRIEHDSRGARTLVPARDISGVLYGYQRIYSEKLDLGDKFFRKGARKEGCFHRLGFCSTETPEKIWLAEGISTAITVYEALGQTEVVLSCFDAGNLIHVAKAVRGRYPNVEIIFPCDNDQWPRGDGTVVNTGVLKARLAADAVGNSRLIVPQFDSGLGTRPTDFDDLRLLKGLDAVREQLKKEPANETKEVEKKKPTSEATIASWILQEQGHNLVRQGKALFRYNGTHWVELEDWDLDQIKNRINQKMGDVLGSKAVDSAYKTFFRLVGHVPKDVNLFTPNPKFGNFLDGTLTLHRNEATGVYCLGFREHRREDYLTWVVPVKYRCDTAKRNPVFDQLLDEALAGHPDAKGVLRALKQMGGALLIPAFQQLYFLQGISGSRKSTIVLCLTKLLAEQNVSIVDPALMEGFQLEGMIGRLVNVVLDIDDTAPLPRGFLKRFADNLPMQINRKQKTVVKVRLPLVHIYCANNLPPNFEAEGKAFQRRITILQFKNDLTHGEQPTGVKKDYQDLVWASGYEGVLNFCREGLEDLVNSGGTFFTPTSSLAGLAEWQMEHDVMGQFLEAIAHQEVEGQDRIIRAPGAKILRKNLWELFKVWREANARCVDSHERWFCRAMRRNGFRDSTLGKQRAWLGIGQVQDEETLI